MVVARRFDGWWDPLGAAGGAGGARPAEGGTARLIPSPAGSTPHATTHLAACVKHAVAHEQAELQVVAAGHHAQLSQAAVDRDGVAPGGVRAP